LEGKGSRVKILPKGRELFLFSKKERTTGGGEGTPEVGGEEGGEVCPWDGRGFLKKKHRRVGEAERNPMRKKRGGELARVGLIFLEGEEKK